jgi:hypothetical protein
MLTVQQITPGDEMQLTLAQILPVPFRNNADGADIWLYNNDDGDTPADSATWYDGMKYQWPGETSPSWLLAGLQMFAQYDANNPTGIIKVATTQFAAVGANDSYFHCIPRNSSTWINRSTAHLYKYLDIYHALHHNNNGDQPTLDWEDGQTARTVAPDYRLPFISRNQLTVSTGWMEQTNLSALADFFGVLLGFIKIRGPRKRVDNRRSKGNRSYRRRR